MVLDASALLALINSEPGAETVAAALADATIGAVNLAEVVTKLIELGIREQDAWAEAPDISSQASSISAPSSPAAPPGCDRPLGQRACRSATVPALL